MTDVMRIVNGPGGLWLLLLAAVLFLLGVFWICDRIFDAVVEAHKRRQTWKASHVPPRAPGLQKPSRVITFEEKVKR